VRVEESERDNEVPSAPVYLIFKSMSTNRVFLTQGQHHYSSLENLLATDDTTSTNLTNLKQRPHYGSTESISSLGSQRNLEDAVTGSRGGRTTRQNATRMTQTPTSLYSAESSTLNVSRDSNEINVTTDEDDFSKILYDVPSNRPTTGGSTTLQKSNSRVASVGRLRLHVESFRQAKNSSGTQTDQVVRNHKVNNGTGTGVMKYTGQYKKHAAPPSKPIRKTKPSQQQNSTNSSGGSSRRNSQDCQSSGRSDRSASPDNSSTSGYSSPSAGAQSKETSPYGSKVDEKMHESSEGRGEEEGEEEEEDDDDDEDDEDNGSKITVIQIVPATVSNAATSPSPGDEMAMREDMLEEEEEMEESDRNDRIRHHHMQEEETGEMDDYSMMHHEDESSIAASAVEENLRHLRYKQMIQQQQEPPAKLLPQRPGGGGRKRELPKITKLPRPPPPLNPPPKRKLPERVGPSAIANFSFNAPLPSANGAAVSAALPPLRSTPIASNVSNNTKRLYNSRTTGPPRPAPMSSHYGRVPLPPVPELDRSDHERESMSPQPHSRNQTSGRAHAPRALPSPLTTPVMQADLPLMIRQPIPRARRHTPMVNHGGYQVPRDEEVDEVDDTTADGRVDERLRALLMLLNAQNGGRGGLDGETGVDDAVVEGMPKEDTLQYLSQLENVARRLKDQLLMEQPKVQLGLLKASAPTRLRTG
jgi:hypothetical protein